MNKTYRQFIIALFFIFTILNVTAEQQMVWSDWVSLAREKQETWTIVPFKGDGLKVTIKTKNREDAQSIKKIMILFPKKSSAYDTALDTILTIFEEERIAADFTLIFFNNDELGKQALQYTENNNMDLIFSMGSGSTVFVHQNYRNGRIPVVTVCSKDPVLRGQMPDYESGSGTNIAYTSLNAPIELQLDYLLKLNQNLKYIIIMYAVNNTSAVETQVIPLIAEGKKKDIVCMDLAVEDQNRAKEELGKLMPVIVSKQKKLDPGFDQTIFWITGCTSVFNEIETINRYADKIPVLSVVSDVVKEGDNSAALSIGVGFENNAYLAGLYGVGILKGEYQAGELKVGVVSPPDIAINFKKVRQINMKIPFAIFESATIVYNYDGKLVRDASKKKY